MMPIDDTHDPQLRSFVASANDAQTDFPIQNLPLGIFRRSASDELARVGVAIGDEILDLTAVLDSDAGLFEDADQALRSTLRAASLNALMARGRSASSLVRRECSRILRAGGPGEGRGWTIPQRDCQLLLPVEIGDYTDFYASIHHATNVGSMFRPDNPLLPNYKYVPVGYHGRSSSIIVSGTPIRRPWGQLKGDDEAEPVYAPSRLLDYELEVGLFVGFPTRLGERVPLDQADARIFGYCLVNDWSARDIQKWEYQPLGPFLGKSFATSLSPWVITSEALAPFRCPASRRPEGDPAPLPHLSNASDAEGGGMDLTVEAYLASNAMREAGLGPMRLSRGNFSNMYWTPAQLLTHHASNGCSLRSGDLMASGTVSGPSKDSRGCLLELAWRGSEPIALPSGETRKFLADGDEVIFRARCSREGFRAIGFGECRGRVLPAAAGN